MKTIIRSLSTLLLFLLIHSIANGQLTYVYKYNIYSNTGAVYELDSGNSLNLVIEMNSGEPEFSDIAVAPQGEVYGIDGGGTIFRIDLQAGTSEAVGGFSQSAHFALACDSDYNFYTLDFDFQLWSFNLLTQEEEFLIDLGEGTPGDLGFYNGQLVYPSDFLSIRTIEMTTLEVTTIYCLPTEVINMTEVWGISNEFDSCGVEHLLIATSSNVIWRIDAENSAFENLNVTYDTDAGGTMRGSTSTDDLLASTCDGEVTEVDCDAVGIDRLSGNGPIFSFYPHPVMDYIDIVTNESDKVVVMEFIDLNGVPSKIIHDPIAREYIGDLGQGVYLLRATHSSGRRSTQKMVKL